MNDFSILLILYSIGKRLKDLFGYPVYINPNQQSTDLPCFFVQLIPNEHLKQIMGNEYEYKLNIDIIYLIDYNKNNSYTEFYEVINKLDAELQNLDVYKIIDNEETKIGSVGCHNNSFTTELGKMNYRFNIPIMARLIDTEEEAGKVKLRELITNLTLGGKTYETKIK